jgi:hypothetical protein
LTLAKRIVEEREESGIALLTFISGGIGFAAGLVAYLLFLLVVDKKSGPVGYVSRGDLIRARKDKIAGDTIVEKGFWANMYGR